jgi:hypothetical protein
MIWFLAPLAIIAGKAIYDAVTDDSEEEKREKERRNEQQREHERAQVQKENQERLQKTKRDEIIADSCQNLTELYSKNAETLTGIVSTSGYAHFSFSDLENFAAEDIPKKTLALIQRIAMLIPGTSLSATIISQDKEFDNLSAEISALERLHLKLSSREVL